jgi:hypothetical protein
MTETKKRPPAVFIWALLAWIVISFGLRLYFLDNLRWTYDEGIHVLMAQMLARGYAPYEEIFVSYPPLYTLSVDWAWRLFGSVEALQILMSLYALTGLLAVGLIAQRLGGPGAGIAAAIFLSLEPLFFQGSRAVLTEVPSISVASLAVALAAFYLWGPERSRGRGWLIASGVTLAASLMLKILSPFVAGLIGLMILARRFQTADRRSGASFWRGVALDGAIWGLALVLPMAALTLMFNVPALIDQAIRFRFASRGAYEGETNNFLFMLSFLRDNWVISLLALGGLWFIVRDRFREGWFVPVWLLLAVLFALIQVPLRDKHLPLLLPPVSIMAGIGAGWLFRGMGTVRRQKGALHPWSRLLVTGLLMIYVWRTGQVFAGYTGYQLSYLGDSEQILVDFIQKFTAPDDCLITDDPTLAFVAGRPVPPNLAEASSARLRSGYLTTEMLIETAAQTDCQVVAPVADRFQRSAVEFVEWAKANYLGLWLYDQATAVMLVKPVAHSAPEHFMQAQFETQVELVGFDLSPAADGAAHLSLYWRPLRAFEQDYTIFVHLRDAQNNTLLNADHQPYNGLVPTTRWPGGDLIKETIRLDLAQTPPGVYKIYVGMYVFEGDEFHRLPVVADTSGESAVVIPGFVVP